MPAEGNFLGWDDLIRFGTVAAVVWSAAWFISNQATRIKELLYQKFEDLKNVFGDKLDYHERHDDARFENIRKDLLGVRLDLARVSTRSSKYSDNGNGRNGKNVNSS